MASHRLFHVSENSEIRIFEPRLSDNQGLAVWAIDEIHLPNYLLPRDCPRVAFAVKEHTTYEDKKKFFKAISKNRVIAVEYAWRAKIETCELFLYEFLIDDFELLDAGAGYHISRKSVAPISVMKVTKLEDELTKRNIELRYYENLWELRDEVVASTLEFSVIRFRNALPRLSE